MSIFNTANDLSYQLVYGKTYIDNEPCEPLDEIVLHRAGQTRTILAPRNQTHKIWGDIAMELELLFYDGWTL